jgi:hypothetical protein
LFWIWLRSVFVNEKPNGYEAKEPLTKL